MSNPFASLLTRTAKDAGFEDAENSKVLDNIAEISETSATTPRKNTAIAGVPQTPPASSVSVGNSAKKAGAHSRTPLSVAVGGSAAKGPSSRTKSTSPVRPSGAQTAGNTASHASTGRVRASTRTERTEGTPLGSLTPGRIRSASTRDNTTPRGIVSNSSISSISSSGNASSSSSKARSRSTVTQSHTPTLAAHSSTVAVTSVTASGRRRAYTNSSVSTSVSPRGLAANAKTPTKPALAPPVCRTLDSVMRASLGKARNRNTILSPSALPSVNPFSPLALTGAGGSGNSAAQPQTGCTGTPVRARPTATSSSPMLASGGSDGGGEGCSDAAATQEAERQGERVGSELSIESTLTEEERRAVLQRKRTTLRRIRTSIMPAPAVGSVKSTAHVVELQRLVRDSLSPVPDITPLYNIALPIDLTRDSSGSVGVIAIGDIAEGEQSVNPPSIHENDSSLFLPPPPADQSSSIPAIAAARDIIVGENDGEKEKEEGEGGEGKGQQKQPKLKERSSYNPRESLALNQALVSKMLPHKVSKVVRQGKPVPPEAFRDVGVFFSDVVGFTNISAGVSPMQVLQLLNSLFTVMDYCTSQFPLLYKVETIGDAYMVAGGLPEKDPENAKALADFSLLVKEAVAACVKSPLDGSPIEIRMGMHTGGVMAGVVGTLMPRYCLFGDTVNTASRMESTGLPGKVHVSAAFAQKLPQKQKAIIAEVVEVETDLDFDSSMLSDGTDGGDGVWTDVLSPMKSPMKSPKRVKAPQSTLTSPSPVKVPVTPLPIPEVGAGGRVYVLEERGLTVVKGKGEMLTYWLIGSEPAASSNTAIATGGAALTLADGLSLEEIEDDDVRSAAGVAGVVAHCHDLVAQQEAAFLECEGEEYY